MWVPSLTKAQFPGISDLFPDHMGSSLIKSHSGISYEASSNKFCPLAQTLE